MLASSTFSGLQHLIDVANKYITEHGLRFNPSKVNLDPRPEWMLNNLKLKESDSVNYLGVSLYHAKPNVHLVNIINAYRRGVICHGRRWI